MIAVQTCAFDSFYECMIGAFVDSETVARKMNESDSDFVKFLKLTITDGIKGTDIIRARNELLILLQPDSVTRINGCIQIDCESHLTDVYVSIQKSCPELSSIIEKRHCSYCNETVTLKLPFMPNDLRNFNERDIGSSLGLYYNDREVCEVCRKEVKLTRTENEILAFNTFGVALSIKLQNLQRNIQVNGHAYNIYGVI